MKKINKYFIKIATIKKLFLMILLTIVYKFFVIDRMVAHFEMLSDGNKLLDFYAGLENEEYYKLISKYGNEAIQYYNYVQLADLIFPLLVGMTFTFAIALLIKNKHNDFKYTFIVTLPLFTATLFDYLENIGIAIMLRKFPNSLEGIAEVTGIFTAIKMGSYGLSAFIILILTLRLVIKKYKK